MGEDWIKMERPCLLFALVLWEWKPIMVVLVWSVQLEPIVT
jgi:hypothetical protein